MRRADVAVVGAGVIGLATADAILRAGTEVVVYERGVPGNAQSGGESRIFRHIHSDRRLVKFAREGRQLWRDWEERFGRELLAGVGVVLLGSTAPEQLARLQDVGDIAARMIEADEVHERLPLLAPTDGPAMVDEDGGVIRTTATIEALTERLGERLILDEVLAIRSLDNGRVQLHSGAGSREFQRVVVCAGRGSPALAGSAGVSIPVHLWAHARVTYEVLVKPTRPLSCLLDGSRSSGGPEAYADPLPGDREYAVGLYRVPVHDDGSLVQPDALAREVEDTRAYALRALPGIAPAVVDVRHCMLTELPWGEDGIGVWQQGGLTVISGNNMFKHAPALGRALAKAALDDKLDPILEPEAHLGGAEEWSAAVG